MEHLLNLFLGHAKVRASVNTSAQLVKARGAVPGNVVRISKVCADLAAPGIDCNFNGGKHLEGWLGCCSLFVTPLHMTATATVGSTMLSGSLGSARLGALAAACFAALFGWIRSSGLALKKNCRSCHTSRMIYYRGWPCLMPDCTDCGAQEI